ncbi:hypothetical protein EDB80DRAFT_528496, partial [Ilyonectria destructans]
MHFSAILPVITLILGTTNAVAIDESLVEPRSRQCPNGVGIDLIKLVGVGRHGGGTFIGVGIPTCCYELPSNVKTFNIDESVGLNGFECTVFQNKNCQGSEVILDNTVKKLSENNQDFKSWS